MIHFRPFTRLFSASVAIFFILFLPVAANAQCDADFDFGTSDTICINQVLSLVDASTTSNMIVGWQWTANGNQMPPTGPGTANFSSPDEGIFDIMLVVEDNQGCSDTEVKTIVVLGNPDAFAVAQNMSCHGLCDGQVEVIYDSENAAAYTATWVGPGGGTTTLSDLCVGVYTAVITDDFGCTMSPWTVEAQVFEPTELEAVVTNGTNVYACPGGSPIELDLNISGGTIGSADPYSVSWSPPDYLSASDIPNPLLTPLEVNMGTTYTATVVDANGCEAETDVVLLPTTGQVQGEITVGGVACSSCEVVLYKLNAGNWDRFLSVSTFGQGQYQFQAVPGMVEFCLMVDPADGHYPSVPQTYYGNPDPTHRWEDAFVLNTGCNTTTEKDVDVPLPPAANGSCTLRGRLMKSYINKVQSEDPIPLIDVVVEKTPPGNPQGKSTTNSNGEFEFEFMPESDTSFYTLYVNMPGLPMVSPYVIQVNPGDVLYDNLDLCVNIDSTEIETCTLLGVGHVTEEVQLSVFPNPNTGEFSLTTGNFAGRSVQLDIIDVSGRMVMNRSYTAAPNVIPFSGLPNGFYLVRLQDGQEVATLRVSVIRN